MPVGMVEKGARALPEMDDVADQVSRVRSIITDAVDDGVQSAMKAIRQGRQVAADALDDATDAVRSNPMRSVGAVLAAGIVIGALAMWMGSRRD